MIPKIIHYCWFSKELSPVAIKCIDSWHKYMPDYQYKLWNLDNFDINSNLYAKQAFEVGKYAFAADYVRLYALYTEGGIYLDCDVEVFKPFDDLLSLKAFAGFEGSKYNPVMGALFASEAGGAWVKEQLSMYDDRAFIREDGTFDMTTNTQIITSRMVEDGFVQNGKLQQYKDLTVFPVDYFCPRQTTGEYIRTSNTYCDHLGCGAWIDKKGGWKSHLKTIIGSRNMTRLIKLKRALER